MTLTFSPGTDFEDIVDGLERVEVTQQNSVVHSVASALRRAVDHSEPERASGDVRQSDTVWHLPYAEMACRPDLGGLVASMGADVDGDLVWVIQSVAHQTMRKRWRCVCRQVDILDQLDTLVTLQLVTYSKGTHGETVETWADDSTDVRAKVQKLDTSVEMEHSAWKDEIGYRIFFEADQTLGKQYRIVDSDGDTYRILRVNQSEDLGAAQVVDAEAWI